MTEARGFPAFPPQRRAKRFARTWWGNAWIKALEDTALDQEQLKKGRRYSYTGHVGAITVSPGRIAAPVHDDIDDTPYYTRVFFRQLSAREWERFLQQVAERSGHIAALLDRDMPQDLADAAEDAGISLLPDIGDLEPECDCPGWELPCKHAAALSYQASWLLDADPFVLLLMRGRGERELLGELQRRNARAPVSQAAGTDAREAYARAVPPLPPPPDLTELSDVDVPALTLPPSSSVEPELLRRLVADASARARELLGAGQQDVQ